MSTPTRTELLAIAGRRTEEEAADLERFTPTRKPRVGQIAWVWGFGAWRRGRVVSVARTRAVVAFTTPSSTRTWGRPTRFVDLRRD